MVNKGEDMSVCPECGNNAFYTKKKGPHTGKYCSACNKWIQWMRGDWKTFIWPLGPTHKGQTLLSIAEKDPGYIDWCVQKLDGSIQERAKEAQAYLRGEPKPMEKVKKKGFVAVQQSLFENQ